MLYVVSDIVVLAMLGEIMNRGNVLNLPSTPLFWVDERLVCDLPTIEFGLCCFLLLRRRQVAICG